MLQINPHEHLSRTAVLLFILPPMLVVRTSSSCSSIEVVLSTRKIRYVTVTQMIYVDQCLCVCFISNMAPKSGCTAQNLAQSRSHSKADAAIQKHLDIIEGVK